VTAGAEPARFAVELSSIAIRNLEALPPRIMTAIVEFIYGDLARHPRRVGKPLQRELDGTWSARRGPYRVLYRIEAQCVVVRVVRVEHRADVYRPR
jgi:mRNA interferase RelE/StbE